VDERSHRVERRLEPIVLAAALLVIPVIVVEQSSLGEPWRAIAGVTNWAIWLVFLAEVIVMLAVVSNRTRWLRDHPLEILIVVLTAPLYPASLQAARVLRLLRLLRLVRIVALARRLFTMEGLQYAALLAVLTAIGGGAAFSYAEKGRSMWDGVWWAVATMTTVGYGDIYPRTDLGRAIAIPVMVVGIGFLSLLIGAVAQRFVSAEVEQEVAEAEQEIEAGLEETEADLLIEIRAIGARLQRIEAMVGRRYQGS
jgi:voltage-gated potassium channel